MSLPNYIRKVYAHSRCLYTKADVGAALDRMALHINTELEDTNPVLLCVVLGGIVPLGNLLPRINFPLEVDYIHVTRYRGETTGGQLDFLKEPSSPLSGRNVVVVDDILDGGITLKAIVDYCQSQQAKHVYTAALVDKTEARDPEGWPQADFTGLTVGDYFVFGYGMDYQEYLRNAPGIFAIGEDKLAEINDQFQDILSENK